MLLLFRVHKASHYPRSHIRKLPTAEEIHDISYRNTIPGKVTLIPRHLWMAFKDVPAAADLKTYQKKMFEKNKAANWTVHLEDNAGKLAFMERYVAVFDVLPVHSREC